MNVTKDILTDIVYFVLLAEIKNRHHYVGFELGALWRLLHTQLWR